MSVSLAMLVKSPPLDRMAALIDAVRPVIDEVVVVVDDRTGVADCDAMAAMGCRLVPFTWCDDFSAGRNAALPHCSGDWILHLDPDEMPSPNMLAFIGMVRASPWVAKVDWYGQSHLDPRGYLFWTTDSNGHANLKIEHDWHCRLFRADRGRWYKPVHEQVALEGMPEGMTRETPMLVKAPRAAYLIHEGVGSAEKSALYARLEAKG